MKKEFVMRGKTAGDQHLKAPETLNFSGMAKGYAYRLIEFQLYPSENIGAEIGELSATLTAAKTYEDPINPNFNNEGLIGVASVGYRNDGKYYEAAVINDTFLITQNLILAVIDTDAAAQDVNWQCRFVMEKMSGPEEAANNYKQFTISDA
jgi:hypothetical protein